VFRVEIFVDDKRLAQLLHNMAGVIIGEPKIQPVANGAVQGGKPIAANSGEICDLFKAFVKKQKLTQIKAPNMREFCKANGLSIGSYSYVLKKLYECKMIKKHGTGSTTYYTVIS
jgi:hypothetical protein